MKHWNQISSPLKRALALCEQNIIFAESHTPFQSKPDGVSGLEWIRILKWAIALDTQNTDERIHRQKILAKVQKHVGSNG